MKEENKFQWDWEKDSYVDSREESKEAYIEEESRKEYMDESY